MKQTFSERLTQAIHRVGKTKAERATKLGYTVRHMDNIEQGKGLARVLEQWEQAGVIHITGSCPCSQPKDEQITA